ncbi:MAG: hypothetical protein RR400_02435 [Clostridia bacterium]
MPSKIQIKRGLSTAVGPLSFSAGEMAFATDSGKLYIGDGTKKVLVNPTSSPSLSYFYAWNSVTPQVSVPPNQFLTFTNNMQKGMDVSLSPEGYIMINTPGGYLINYQLVSKTPSINTVLFNIGNGNIGGYSANSSTLQNSMVGANGTVIFSLTVVPQKITIQNIGKSNIIMEYPNIPNISVVKID